MPCCCVVGCHNRAEKGHKLYKLPQGVKNNDRRKLWIQNIGRKDPLPHHAYVCQGHFTNDQFELGRADHKKLLKWNAVPTIFFHHKNHYNTISSKRHSKELTSINNSINNDSFEQIMKEDVKKEIKSKVESFANNGNQSNEVIILRQRLKASQQEIYTLKTIIHQLQTIIERLVDTNEIDESANEFT